MNIKIPNLNEVYFFINIKFFNSFINLFNTVIWINFFFLLIINMEFNIEIKLKNNNNSNEVMIAVW